VPASSGAVSGRGRRPSGRSSPSPVLLTLAVLCPTVTPGERNHATAGVAHGHLGRAVFDVTVSGDDQPAFRGHSGNPLGVGRVSKLVIGHGGRSCLCTTSTGSLGDVMSGRSWASTSASRGCPGRPRQGVSHIPVNDAGTGAARRLPLSRSAAEDRHDGIVRFGYQLKLAPRGCCDQYKANGVSPQPDEPCRGRLPLLGQAHAGTRGQGDRPPPLASPRCVDHDTKCVCAGQVRCRCAVERAPSTLRPSDLTREHQT
jgi:hypothetical protein